MDLHDIDKRLAVLQALSTRHMEKTDKDLAEIKKSLTGMQIKVYSIAMTISIFIGGISRQE